MLRRIVMALLVVCVCVGMCSCDTPAKKRKETYDDAQVVTADVNAQEIFKAAQQVCSNYSVEGKPVPNGSYTRSDTTGFVKDVLDRISNQSANMNFCIVIESGVPTLTTIVSDKDGTYIGKYPN